jgi:hypothetical protein
VEDTKKQNNDGQGFVFVAIYGPLACIFAAAAYFATRPVTAVPLPIFSASHDSVALVGLQVGEHFHMQECPTEQDKYGNITYSALIQKDCYRQLVPGKIGKAVLDDGPLELDLLGLAKKYPAANWRAPVCVGVISGNVEAIEVGLELNSITWKTPAQVLDENTRTLGKQTAHRAYLPFPKAPPVFQADEWQVAGSTSQITQHSFAVSGGRRAGIATVSHAIAFSEKGRTLARDAWKTPKTFCGASDVPVGLSG